MAHAVATKEGLSIEYDESTTCNVCLSVSIQTYFRRLYLFDVFGSKECVKMMSNDMTLSGFIRHKLIIFHLVNTRKLTGEFYI